MPLPLGLIADEVVGATHATPLPLGLTADARP